MRLDALSDAFLSHLRAERALSKNTLESYGRDLRKFSEFAEQAGVSMARAVDLGLVSAWLSDLAEAKLHPRSAARHLSSLRGLMRFALKEGLIEKDPTALAARPRTGRRLPRPIGENDVLRMLEVPDVSTYKGLRDRAMLSLTYAAGLRVSELISLKLGDVDLQRGVLAAFGKGGKRRLVPIGEVALAHLDEYLVAKRTATTDNDEPGPARKGAKRATKVVSPRADSRLQAAGSRKNSAPKPGNESPRASALVFCSARGRPFTRQMFWKLVRRVALAAGVRDAAHPHRLRHAFATPCSYTVRICAVCRPCSAIRTFRRRRSIRTFRRTMSERPTSELIPARKGYGRSQIVRGKALAIARVSWRSERRRRVLICSI